MFKAYFEYNGYTVLQRAHCSILMGPDQQKLANKMQRYPNADCGHGYESCHAEQIKR